MESYIMITQINDFIFCPRSIYFHDIYRATADPDTYQQAPQKIGQSSHSTIDHSTYSTRKEIITGLMVYSQKYGLLGRIDILDTSQGILTERKYSVTAIYEGFRYQLYAQYFALLEMGYYVSAMRIHSIKDNKNYPIDIPNLEETNQFDATLEQMKSFDLQAPFNQNPKKCQHCVYNSLCDIWQG